MRLAAGQRVGPYEIAAAIGAGGMGEVYRARDARLKRNIALKILPESFASDPERLARFQREAEVLTSLNHPNIAAIYGVEESDGIRAPLFTPRRPRQFRLEADSHSADRAESQHFAPPPDLGGA